MIPALSVERTDFVEIRDEWTALATRAPSIFTTWEWADAWWRHHGREGRLLLHACRDIDDELVAVVPLYLWRRRPLRILRFVGHGPGDELGPVCNPSRAGAATALRLTLEGLDFDVFLGELLSGEHRADLPDARLWRREASPRMNLPDEGWPAYLELRSAAFRQQLGRRRRALEKLDAQYRLADSSTLEGDLDTLFALHRARWSGRPSDFVDSPFQREISRTALSRGWLRLWLLELGGKPIAAWHGFNVGGLVSYYQAGRDPGHDHLSAGFALMAHSIEQACLERASEYRFGRGAEAFKRRFGSEDPGLEAVAVPHGILGRLALAAARTGRAGRNVLLRR